MKEFIATTVQWWGDRASLKKRALRLAGKLPEEVRKAKGGMFSYEEFTALSQGGQLGRL